MVCAGGGGDARSLLLSDMLRSRCRSRYVSLRGLGLSCGRPSLACRLRVVASLSLLAPNMGDDGSLTREESTSASACIATGACRCSASSAAAPTDSASLSPLELLAALLALPLPLLLPLDLCDNTSASSSLLSDVTYTCCLPFPTDAGLLATGCLCAPDAEAGVFPLDASCGGFVAECACAGGLSMSASSTDSDEERSTSSISDDCHRMDGRCGDAFCAVGLRAIGSCAADDFLGGVRATGDAAADVTVAARFESLNVTSSWLSLSLRSKNRIKPRRYKKETLHCHIGPQGVTDNIIHEPVALYGYGSISAF